MSFIINKLDYIDYNILKTNREVRNHLTTISKGLTQQVYLTNTKYHRDRYNHVAQVIGAYVTANIFGNAKYLSIQGEIPLSLRKKRSRGRMCSADFVDYLQRYASEIKRFGKDISKKKMKVHLKHALLQLEETSYQTIIEQKIIVVFARSSPCLLITEWIWENIIQRDVDIIWLYNEKYAVHELIKLKFNITIE
jgi:hypothetical protein